MEEFKKYPEQNWAVHGNKIWLDLPEDRTIAINPQARKILQWAEVDEEKFIQKLKELQECFKNKQYGFNMLYVGKTRIPEMSDEECEEPVLVIRIETR